MKKQSQTERMKEEFKARQIQYDMIYRTKQFFDRESNPLSLNNRMNSKDDRTNKQYIELKQFKFEEKKRDRQQLTLQSLSCENQTMKENQQIFHLDFGLILAITLPFLFLFGLMIWLKPK